MNSKVSIVKCKDYNPDLVLEAIRRAVNLLGGISNFVKPQSRVLVKPNLLMAKAAEFGITTHPEVLRATIKILKEIGCEVLIGDSPSVWGNQIENVDEVYEKTGTKKIAEEEGALLVRFDKRCWRGKFPLTAWLDHCDCLVSIAKFKTHELTILTAGIKNLFGLVCGTYKTELHKQYFYHEDFARAVVDIYAEAKPALTIVDGIVAMEGDGPGTAGTLRNLGLLFAGSDCVALDSVLAAVMGIKPLDVLTTKEAARRGMGVADINRIDILGEKLNNAIGETFKLPAASITRKIPKPFIQIARRLIRYYPYVSHIDCTSCTACIKACPEKIISLKSGRITFDYRKCIACFCCQEVCPHAAIKLKKTLFAKLIGL